MMQRFLIAPIVVWCGTIVPALRAQAPEEAAVRRVVEAVGSLQEANDIAALDTLFAPNPWVEIIEGSGVNHGWTDYWNNHLKPELVEMQHLRFRFFRHRTSGAGQGGLGAVPLRASGGHAHRACRRRRARDRHPRATWGTVAGCAPPYIGTPENAGRLSRWNNITTMTTPRLRRRSRRRPSTATRQMRTLGTGRTWCRTCSAGSSGRRSSPSRSSSTRRWAPRSSAASSRRHLGCRPGS